MRNITVEVMKDEDLGQCEDLCNELMALQKSKSRLHPECFDGMNFHTRMEKSYINAFRKQVLIAREGQTPIGYVFSTVDKIVEEYRSALPDWAPKGENHIGFFPEWVKLPQYIGCLQLVCAPGIPPHGTGSKTPFRVNAVAGKFSRRRFAFCVCFKWK